MPWTYSTWGGQYAFGPSGAIKTGMFELCRAINQRQGHLGITKTQWYKGNGTQAADIAISDLVGLRTDGANYKTNLARIYEAIRAMTPFFKLTGSGLPAWSVSAMETAIGSTLTPTLTGRRICDPLTFQVAQDALDNLIYISKTLTINDSGTPSDNVDREFSGSYRPGIADPPPGQLNTAQDAWDALGTYVYNVGAQKNSSVAVIAYRSSMYGPEYDAARIVGGQNVEIDFSGFGYTVLAGSTWYQFAGHNFFDTAMNFTFSGAGGTLEQDETINTWLLGTNLLLDTPTTADLSTSFDGASTVPGSPPMPATGTNTWTSSIVCGAVTVVFSIASLLEDQ